MMKAIFYKEWIKTYRYGLLMLATLWAFVGYCLLTMHRIAELKGANHLWETMLQRDAIFIDRLRYLPLLAGVLFALVQFVPEMHRKCLKLTLHLPCSTHRVLWGMLLSGVGLLLGCFFTCFLWLHFGMSELLAWELERHILWSAAPWFLAGLAGYLLTGWIVLEPTWKRRVLNLAVAVLLLRIFFVSDTPEAYVPYMPLWMVGTAVTACLSWLSVERFKAGRQD